MIQPHHRALAIAFGVALVLSTAACGRDRDTAANTDTSTAAGTVGTPAPSATATLRVTEVEIGRGMRGDTALAEETDDFVTRDTIHALVRHEGAASGAQVTARWTFEDGQVVDERTETISPTGTRPEYTHFMIAKPTAWPTGKYTLHVLVNGQEVETEEFEVKAGR
ncbi:MAG: hypothetical protein ACREON_15430 [Gemmatimonadaceae bacterium]